MKYVKILSVAAIAAMAFMAFASMASATELYSGSKTLSTGTTISGSLSGGTAKFEDTSANVLDTCTGGGLTGTTTNAGGAGLIVKMSVAASGVPWTGCTVPTSTTGSGELQIAWTSGLNATVIAKNFKISMNTILFGNCVYGFGTTGHTIGTLFGSTTSTASLEIDSTITRSSGICESTGRLNATYNFTSPDPLHATNS